MSNVYYYPQPDDEYRKDDNNPLNRELWKVYAVNDTAYIIPRPDGLGLKYNLCNDGFESRDLAMAYGLCNQTITDPSIINSMDPDAALVFANVFHRQLVFRVGQDSLRIEPYAPARDILAACKELAVTSDAPPSEETQQFCEVVWDSCKNNVCAELKEDPTLFVLDELVPMLHQIYGILPKKAPCDPDLWGTSFDCPVAEDCPPPPDGCQYDPAHYVLNDVRDCCPALCYATDSMGNVCSSANRVVGLEWLLVVGIVSVFWCGRRGF